MVKTGEQRATGRKKRHPESSLEAQGQVGRPAGGGSLDTSQGHHPWGSSLAPGWFCVRVRMLLAYKIQRREMQAPEASSQASTTNEIPITTCWKETTSHQNCPMLLPPVRRKSTEDRSISNPQDGLSPISRAQKPKILQSVRTFLMTWPCHQQL